MPFHPVAPTKINPQYSVFAWVVVALAAVVYLHYLMNSGQNQRFVHFLQNHRQSTQHNHTPNHDWIVQLHEFTWTEGPKSQGAQDIYLFAIFNVIGTTNRYFVEFGFNEPSYTSGGSGANTRNLYEHGWRGLLLDAGHENPEINLRRHYLYQSNIVDIFDAYSVPRELDYLSCDMDSHDLFVLEASLRGGYRPRVMTTEFNNNYPLGLSITQVDPTLEEEKAGDHTFTFKECAWGASATALETVAAMYGYTLVGRIGVLDLVWLRNDLIQQHWVVPEFAWFFDPLMGHTLHHEKQTSREIFNHLLDYDVYQATHSLEAAKQAARSQLLGFQLPCYRDIDHDLTL